MRGAVRMEREISAQGNPVSGMDRTASRTIVPPILPPPPLRCAPLRQRQNRHPHRRWRGRFAVLDPARSMPGAPSCLLRAGGNHGSRTAYRRTARRASEHQRRDRNPADRGRVAGRPGRAGEVGNGNGLIGHTAGRSDAIGALLLLSCCSRMADLRGSGRFEADRTRSARLKLDPAGGIKSLSAHRYFTRQASTTARQGCPKPLIVLERAGDRSPGSAATCPADLAGGRHER